MQVPYRPRVLYESLIIIKNMHELLTIIKTTINEVLIITKIIS